MRRRMPSFRPDGSRFGQSSDASGINGGNKAGVFPPVVNDGSNCPTLPQPIYSAPSSATGAHHSYPGGRMVHETFNSVSDMNFANGTGTCMAPAQMACRPLRTRTCPWACRIRTFSSRRSHYRRAPVARLGQADRFPMGGRRHGVCRTQLRWQRNHRRVGSGW